MEASTLQSPALTAGQPRIALVGPLLRLRSDEQLVALFRAGHDEAFRVIHDRYHKRLFAYARQMLPARQDAEDALQDVFVRAYSGLRASDRDLALRAWLFRVAHNRCVDELRKPTPPPPEVLHLVRTNQRDPLAEVDLRESLRRLVEDIRRLPEQQRSALLMRELAGMSYAELASSLGISVGAVKSLLVRARLGLAQAAAARDTACTLIREQLVEAHDRGIRPNANTRKHVRDCSGCKSFRHELRGVSRQLAATAPAIGPLGFLAKLLGFSGGGGAAGGGGGVALLGGGGTTASAGGLALSTSHVATLVVAAVATAGGAVEIQHTILPAATHVASAPPRAAGPHASAVAVSAASLPIQTGAYVPPASIASAVQGTSDVTSPGPAAATRPTSPAADSTDPDRGAGGAAAKRHALSKSSTTAATRTTTTTTGSSANGTCAAAPASSNSTAATTSTPSSTSSGSTSTTASPATGTSSPASSAATPSACGSAPASSSGTSSTSSSSPPTSSGSSTGTPSTQGTASSSSAAATPSAGTSSPPSSTAGATG